MNAAKQQQKDRFMSALERAFMERGDAVTAGQVALEAGSSRNTAKKWIHALCGDEVVRQVTGEHVNGQLKRGYIPNKKCPDCGCRKQEETGWQEERGYGALYWHWTISCWQCGCALDGGTTDLQD